MSVIQRKIHSDVAAQRWSWIWVFDPDVEHPPFAYSVGFASSYGRPEVVVAGLPEEISGLIISSVESVLAGGVTLRGGDVAGEILEGFNVRFRAISRDILISNLVQASVFYGESSFDALQLLCPDRDGKFPGEEGAPSWLSDRQDLLT